MTQYKENQCCVDGAGSTESPCGFQSVLEGVAISTDKEINTPITKKFSSMY